MPDSGDGDIAAAAGPAPAQKQAPLGPSIAPVALAWSTIHSLHYEQLANQQNMLQDSARTSTYHDAILSNPSDFRDRVVLDVGAGSGILSFFAAHAGARHVYAVEATTSADYARRLIANAGLSDRITVIQAPLDEVTLPERVDVIVSEPLGSFLVHERMLDTFILARDRWLKPGGKMFPARARLWLAPFCDAHLHEERARRPDFWRQTSFYGIDLTPLWDDAILEVFAMPACGPVDPRILMASPSVYSIDFATITPAALAELTVDVDFTMAHPGVVHGLAGWFDVTFPGADKEVELTTAPGAPETHWHQMRFLFLEPAEVRLGQRLRGRMLLRANVESSYDIGFVGELEGRGALAAQRYLLHRHIFWWHNGVK